MVLLSELEGKYREGPLPSLSQRFSHVVVTCPNNVALISTHQQHDLYGIPSEVLHDEHYKASPYLRWSFKNFDSGVERLTQGLKSRSVRRGTPVIAFLPNGAEHALLVWAVHRLGGVHVPINPRNLSNTQEVTHMIKIALSVRPDESAFIVAGSFDVARQIQALELSHDFRLTIVGTDETESGIIPFSDLMEPSNNEVIDVGPKDKTRTQDELVLFTSGTTSLPKGCWYPNRLSRLVEWRKELEVITPSDVCCIVAPNNHGIGYVWLLFAHCAGAAVCYPGPAFAPQTMMETMIRENVTHTGLVPTMIHALLGVKAGRGGKMPSLKSVFVGGTTISPDMLSQCMDGLGFKAVENAFGMTEGVFLFSGPKETTDLLVRGEDVAVGARTGDSKVRVCKPGTQVALPRGQPGELHYSSSTLADGYINQQTDDFYKDGHGRPWFKTGDQAVINEEGMLFIVGRYKEMIIRGGENIAPAAIEAVVARVENLSRLNLQIVGAPDPIAGEVPVAVIDGEVDEKLIQEIQSTILTKIGPAFVPDEFLGAQSIGLDGFPKTMGGKIQKTKIAASVRKHRQRQATHGFDKNRGLERMADLVKKAWTRVVGYEVGEDTPVSAFADSITVMRARDMIFREVGKNLSLVEIMEADTIRGQIELLQGREANGNGNNNRRLQGARRPGLVSHTDIVHLSHSPDSFRKTKFLVERTLKPYQFDWTDVEDVLPACDLEQTLAREGVFDTWTFKFALLSRGLSKSAVRTAVERTLSNHRLLPSFFIRGDDGIESGPALHVILRQSPRLYERCIQDIGSVETKHALSQLTLTCPQSQQCTYPGPMTRALLVDVKETNSAAIVLIVHHAVLDASYGLQIFADLGLALGGKEPQAHIDYKIWAESYFALKTSFEGDEAVSWHVERLRNLTSHRSAIWPRTEERTYGLAEDGEEPAYTHEFKLPNLSHYRQHHSEIAAPVVFKAICALLNIYHTDYSHVVFSNLEAARTRFPFVPKALDALDGQRYEATDVAGPTFQMAVNLIEFIPHESVTSFIERLQEEQKMVTRYASAPLERVMTALGTEASRMMMDVLKAQIYNWVPSFLTGSGAEREDQGEGQYEHMDVVNGVVRPATGFSCNVTVAADEGKAATVKLTLRTCAFTKEELKLLARQFEAISRWATDVNNSERPVGEFRTALDGLDEKLGNVSM